MTHSYTRTIPVPAASVWQVIEEAHGNPTVLTGQETTPGRSRAPWSVSAYEGYVYLVDVDADERVATVSFEGTERATGRRARWSTRLGVGGGRWFSHVHGQMTGSVNEPEAVSEELVQAIHQRARTTSRTPRWVVFAVSAAGAALLGGLWVWRWRR